MKVAAFSLMLFGFVKVVSASECDSAYETVTTCLANLEELPLYADDFVESLHDEEKKDLFCCAFEDLDNCVDRHMVGNCASLASTVRNYGREMVLNELEREYGKLPCGADPKERCRPMRSRVGL
ncbi:uncharacterized protein LOC135400060 [Ornithodoros turicata]|uniref:uncharacterized protein LOC135400060 n=1 Tax=Ornithodoros turicata TaxID=34597 RepID=UPI00313A468A